MRTQRTLNVLVGVFHLSPGNPHMVLFLRLARAAAGVRPPVRYVAILARALGGGGARRRCRRLSLNSLAATLMRSTLRQRLPGQHVHPNRLQRARPVDNLREQHTHEQGAASVRRDVI